MATADLDFNIKLNGTPDEIASLLNIMFEYFEGKDGVYFSCATVNADDREFRLSCSQKDEVLSAARSSETVTVNALGPYGKYGELDEIEIFRDMAQAAPKVSFTASIIGFAGYADQSLHADLSNGLLKVSTSYLSDDCRSEGEMEYYSSNLPYDKFIELFKLDSEEFDEEMYEDFMSDTFCSYDSIGEFLEETDYEDFIGQFDCECPLTEDEYSEITEQFMDMDCVTCGEYLEQEGFVVRETYTYDPVEKKYIDGSGPKMKSGVAYSINDDISAYLDSIGHPSDEEAINALSVEDVYAILAGAYGKETAEKDEDSESDEAEEPADESEAEESEEENPDDEESDDEEADEQEAAAEVEAESEVVAEAEPETAETENASPAKKRSFPIWLIVLLIAIILAGIGAYVFGFGEAAWNYIADLLGTAH